jgi:hypothetical protein
MALASRAFLTFSGPRWVFGIVAVIVILLLISPANFTYRKKQFDRIIIAQNAYVFKS